MRSRSRRINCAAIAALVTALASCSTGQWHPAKTWSPGGKSHGGLTRVLGPLPAAHKDCDAKVFQVVASAAAVFATELTCDQAGDRRVVAKGVPERVFYQLKPDGRVAVLTASIDGRPVPIISLLDVAADGRLLALGGKELTPSLLTRTPAGQWQKVRAPTREPRNLAGNISDGAIGADGSTYLSGYQSVYRLDSSGNLSLVAGVPNDQFTDFPLPPAPSTPTVATQVHLPTPVAIDEQPGIGLWITTQPRVYLLTHDGRLHTVVDAADKGSPVSRSMFSGAAIDTANHILYLRDERHARVLALNTDTRQVSVVVHQPKPLGKAFGFGTLALHGHGLLMPVTNSLWRLPVAGG